MWDVSVVTAVLVVSVCCIYMVVRTRSKAEKAEDSGTLMYCAAESVLHTVHGPAAIRDVHAGDLVKTLTKDGREDYDQVVFVPYVAAAVSRRYMKLTTEEGDVITLDPSAKVLTDSGTLVQADHLVAGDIVRPKRTIRSSECVLGPTRPIILTHKNPFLMVNGVYVAYPCEALQGIHHLQASPTLIQVVGTIYQSLFFLPLEAKR